MDATKGQKSTIDDHVLYIPKVLPEADLIFQRLRDEVPWKEIVWRAGRKLPRLCCHSVQTEAQVGIVMIAWLQYFFLSAYNTETEIADCFGNYYRTGKDWLPYHRDQYDDFHVISVSFGATRKFNFQASRAYDLSEGDVIVFDPYMNKHYTHGIPKQESVKGARINLTFFVHFSNPPYGKKMNEVEIMSPSEVYALLLSGGEPQ